MKGKFGLEVKFKNITADNCFISEITLAELKFGVENSENREKNKKVLDDFLTGVQVLPIYHSIDLYAKEKTRLRKAGTPIDDFDLNGFIFGFLPILHILSRLICKDYFHNFFKGILVTLPAFKSSILFLRCVLFASVESR
jgi:tRNA(fMet)-specific endonuclease VapC